jgi:fructokinase
VILVCGEALVDLVATSPRDYRAVPGGSPANVAVGIARLGVSVELLARLSTDVMGRMLTQHLRDNGVGLSHAVHTDAPSTLAVASVDDDAQATYTFYAAGTADWQWSADELPTLSNDLRILHTGSLALALPPGAAALEELMRHARATERVLVSYDPNVRRGLEPDPGRLAQRVERQAALAHVVKASADDLAATHPDRPYADVARGWLQRGAALVVITLGADGATAFTAGHEVHCAAPVVDVVDTVGAGDAFTAALLAGLCRLPETTPPAQAVATLPAATLAALLDDAVAAASYTCTRQGADPPRRGELRA